MALVTAGLVSFLHGRFGYLLPGGGLVLSDFALALLAFSGITFGGCVAGATLAVALPNGRALSTLTVNGRSSQRAKLLKKEGGIAVVWNDSEAPVTLSDFEYGFKSNYADLVFLFVYSAFVQLFVASLGLFTMFFYSDLRTVECGCSLSENLIVWVTVAAFLYSLFLLAACLRALLSIGMIRDAFVRAAAVEGSPTDFEP